MIAISQPDVDIDRQTQLLRNKLEELGVSLHDRNDLNIESAADVLDVIQGQLLRDLAVDRITRTTRIAADVRNALQRIADGTYGICEECDEDINPKRLQAIPWASLCVHCQEKLERREASRAAEFAMAAEA